MENYNREKTFVDFMDAYNECFYKKDIEELKKFYDVKNNRLIYFDNHKGNDTYYLDEHLDLLASFFKNGKETESGDVETLIMENMNVFQQEKAACICFIARYKSFPDPAVRCTYYLEEVDHEWKIIHAHGSFEPK